MRQSTLPAVIKKVLSISMSSISCIKFTASLLTLRRRRDAKGRAHGDEGKIFSGCPLDSRTNPFDATVESKRNDTDPVLYSAFAQHRVA